MSQYPFDGLTGGGDALDGIPYAGLSAINKAYGRGANYFYPYRYDPTNNNTTYPEFPPGIIVPDDNASGAGAWISSVLDFYPDASQADQGATVGGLATVKDIIDHVGTSVKVTIVLKRDAYDSETNYIFLTNEVIPSNFTIKYENGARLAPASGITVTIYSPKNIRAGDGQHIFTGTGTITWTVPEGIAYFEWWGAVAGVDADQASTIQVALDSLAGLFILNGIYYHTFNEIQDSQVIQGLGWNTGFKQVSGLTYYDGTPTGSYGLSSKSGIDNCTLKDFSYDGNHEASTDYANDYGDLWDGSSMVQGRIKQANIAFSDLNRTWTAPKTVTLDNIYSFNATRNCFIFQESTMSLNMTNCKAKNSHIDHLVYSDSSNFGNIVNLILEGYAHNGMIVSSGSNWSNIIVRELTENPIFDAVSGYDFQTNRIVDDRADITGSTFSTFTVKGDFRKIDDVNIPSIFQLKTSGGNVSGVRLIDTADDDYAFYIFGIAKANVNRSTHITGVYGKDLSDQTQLAIIDPDVEGNACNGLNISKFGLEYRSGAVTKALGLIEANGNQLKNMNISEGHVWTADFSGGGVGFLFDDNTTDKLENVHFSKIYMPNTDNATELYDIAAGKTDVRNNTFTKIQARCGYPTGIQASYATLRDCTLSEEVNSDIPPIFITTTDATVTDAFSYIAVQGSGIKDDSSYLFTVKVTAVKTGGSDRAVYWIAGCFFRNGANAAQEGATQQVMTPIESDGTWGGPLFAVSGSDTDVKITVTGLAATEITWKLEPVISSNPTP